MIPPLWRAVLRRPEEKKEAGGFSSPCSYGDFWGPYPQSLLLPCRGLLPGADFIETLPGASWPDGPGLSANRERAVISGRLRKPQGDFRGHPDRRYPATTSSNAARFHGSALARKVDERIGQRPETT